MRGPNGTLRRTVMAACVVGCGLLAHRRCTRRTPRRPRRATRPWRPAASTTSARPPTTPSPTQTARSRGRPPLRSSLTRRLSSARRSRGRRQGTPSARRRLRAVHGIAGLTNATDVDGKDKWPQLERRSARWNVTGPDGRMCKLDALTRGAGPGEAARRAGPPRALVEHRGRRRRAPCRRDPSRRHARSR